MSVFGEIYSKYYNLLYKDKNYKEEFDYIHGIIKNYCTKECKTILDIGCGTGKHLSFFKNAGYSVSGIDSSESMINEAKKCLGQEKDLICCEASQFKTDKKYDIIISLFHVMNYHTENKELDFVFRKVSENLHDGGLFIFDFWYGPAVLMDPPVLRIKKLEDEEIKITRRAESAMHYSKNIVAVNFEILVEDKKNHNFETIKETHKMRYFFLPEIEILAQKAGLKNLNFFEWMTQKSLSSNTWYGVGILQK